MRRWFVCVALVLLLAGPAFGQQAQQPGKPNQKGKSEQQVKPQQQQQQQQQQPPQQNKFATCKEAVDGTPGYSQVAVALKNCPEIEKLQNDPNAAMTYFVPSDKAVKDMAAFIGIPPAMVSSPQFKGIMCNVLKYHVVPGMHRKKDWTMGQQLQTTYNNAPLEVVALGKDAQVKTTTGVTATVKRVSFCGNSIAFGIDQVLTPFKVPKLPGFGFGFGKKPTA